MSWKNESRRHALASKGICTGTKGKPIFLGSRAMGESEEEQIEREAQWKEDHACPICEEFRCDGNCNEREMKKIAESEEMDSLAIDMKGCSECGAMRMQGLTPAVCQYHLDAQQRIYNKNHPIWKKIVRTKEGSNKKFDTFEGEDNAISIMKVFNLNKRKDEWDVRKHTISDGMYNLFEGQILGSFYTKKEADKFAKDFMILHK